jgi:hypothetical protein
VHEGHPIREINNVSIFGSSAGAFLVLMAGAWAAVTVTVTRGTGKANINPTLRKVYLQYPYYDNSS